MKYNVTVNKKTYEVDIEDINARPIIARVEGQRFEVVPENRSQPQAKKESAASGEYIMKQAAATGAGVKLDEMHAPLPGTVVEIFVKAGEQIEAGQVILVIEAMKMKNSIRATRSGTIEEVFVNAGQSVAHKQSLLKFAG